MSKTAVPIAIDDVPEAIALTESGTRTEVIAEADAAVVPPTQSLKQRTVRSSIWTVAGFGSSQVIRFGSSIILARLLTTSDFALAGIVGIVMGMLQQFSDIGLGPAIIQNRRGDDPRFLNTAWTMAVVRGVLLWLVACGLAWPVARSYHTPLLVPLIIVAGFNGLLLGFTSTSIFQLNRHLALGKITLVNLGTQIITTGCTIGVACFTHNIWAIIAGGLAGSTFTLVLSHFLMPGQPRNWFAWEPAAARALFHFGGWVFVSTTMTFLANEIDRVIFGWIGGLAIMGVYQLASTLVRMPVELISRLSHMSLYPALARSAESGVEELSRNLRRARGVILPLGIAAVVGMAFGAPIAVAILYPGKFSGAGWMAQFMAVGLWMTVLQTSAERTLPAMGNQRPLALANFVNMAATIGFAFLGHHVGHRFGQTAANPGGYAIQGFILGVAVGNLGGHLVVQASLATRGIWIYWQDFGYSAILGVLFACGVILPRSLGPMVSPQAAQAIALSWHLIVISVTTTWAGLRMWRRMR